MNSPFIVAFSLRVAAISSVRWHLVGSVVVVGLALVVDTWERTCMD